MVSGQAPESPQTQAKSKPDVRKVRPARILEIRDYTQQIRELVLSCEEEFSFRAGQFIMLQVPQPGQSKPALRAYSIASTDRRSDGFRLIFKAVPHGLATRYVWRLKSGDQIKFTGPFGRVFFKEPPPEQLLMLSTGSGISQHFSYLDSFAEIYPQLRVEVIFGVRHETDAYYLGELAKLKGRLPNLSYRFALSRPIQSIAELRSAGLPCFRGYVQDAIDELKPMSRPTHIYLCGNGAMIKATHEKLKALGFDMTNLFEEAFD